MDWSIKELLGSLESRDECHRIEAKQCKESLGKSARETISAFSNEPGLGGGYLILGLKRSDDNLDQERYVVKGVNDPDKLQCELASACRDEFNIKIRPDIRVDVLKGKAVVVAFIPEAFPRDKPIHLKKYGLEKGSFRRIGSADHHCTSEDMDLLYQLCRQQHYESDILPYTSWEDVSLEAVEEYRRLRGKIEPTAHELKLNDQELLLSLKVAVKKDKEIIPTVGGLLLFGRKVALRREMPMAARIDYIIVEGTEWVKDPSKRFQYSTEHREALVTLMPRLHSQLMSDLPSKFRLEPGQLQRSDIPFIPREVIREAIANALMHRDYRSNQPTQIIRYSNRLEFRNAGYSLKSFEEFLVPGSKPRNPIIASVFHELKHAETKGTGIRSMRQWMHEAGLSTPPIIESDRDRNEFDLILLPHHLIDQGALQWLSQFKEVDLSDAQRRALAFTLEIGAITNQDYRQLNGTDTLMASSALRGLRDADLLSQKGKGSKTYYILGPKTAGTSGVLHAQPQQTEDPSSLVSFHDKEKASMLSFHDKEKASMLSLHDKRGLVLPDGFPKLSKVLEEQILSLNQRTPEPEEFKEIIKNLCAVKPLTKKELADILGRTSSHLQNRYLTQMIKDKNLEYLYPNKTVHPKQAYTTPTESIE